MEGRNGEYQDGARLIGLLDEVIASLQYPGETYPSEKLSQLILEINSTWEKADTEEKRVNLLNIFDLAHRALLPAIQDLALKKRIEESRSTIYKTFILSECLIGEHVSTQRLDRVTQREIAANRMTRDHELRKIAETALAAPHLSDEQLFVMKATKLAFPNLTEDELLSKVDEYLQFIAKLENEISLLGERIRNGSEQRPVQRIESLLEEINNHWKLAKLEDDETNVFILHDCWYELKRLHLAILKDEKERSNFENAFYSEYMSHLLSLMSLITPTGESLAGSLPVDRALRVTEREITLGRLPEDAPLRQNALKAKAEGKTDLIMDGIREELRRNPLIQVADNFWILKTIRSFFRFFGI